MGPVPLAELDAVVKDDITSALEILGKDRGIDVFMPMRINAEDRIEDIVGVLQKYKDEGLIKAIGLCEARAATVERARKVGHLILQVRVELMSGH